MKLLITLVMISVVIVAGCSNNDVSTTDPAPIVEQYIQAKVTGNRDQLRDLLCSDQEANLDREAQSFSSVKAEVKDMVCQRDGQDNTVTCTGEIVAEYNGENTPFPLGKYNVKMEDGSWKWCGEAG